MKKWLSLFLCVLMALSVAACGKPKDKGGDSDKNVPDEVVVDLGGYTFTVLDGDKAHFAPESGTSLNDRTLEIVKEVEKTFNCKIEVQVVDPSAMFNKIQPSIMAGDKTADLVVSTTWTFGQLISADLMADLNTFEELDLSNPWWNQSILPKCSLNGKQLAASGSFLTHIEKIWVMFYNKKIWQELGYEDPYKIVRDGKWTWDKWGEFAKGALRDYDGNGVVDSEKDRWGLVAPVGDFSKAMFLSMGGEYYKADGNGGITLACNNEASYNMFNKMTKLIRDDKLMYKDSPDAATSFTSDKSLFFSYLLMPDQHSLHPLRDMKSDFGVLPMPKYDEEQKNYIGAVDHNAPLFGVPKSNQNKREVGIILEALGRRFQGIDKYKTDDWAGVYWRDDETVEMIDDYVVPSAGYDYIIRNANSTLGLPVSAIEGAVFGNSDSGDLASTMKAIESPINEALKDLFGK